ncbi:unnamed protein product [Vitrella brassicaformis CCMP3155]|uniref:PSI subunit V n=1 Tax=Vitrella brassicaformis (strain CCMP3155) TaxID=1169540 RepID=A0A0G4GQJ1_VITBC|nr:unnamed protein product [Vitrella brassicaformis CCMP3155]|eukprot:CEM32718.1 unnamed protein product [Vitrella brassicaformis CCMP3155]
MKVVALLALTAATAATGFVPAPLSRSPLRSLKGGIAPASETATNAVPRVMIDQEHPSDHLQGNILVNSDITQALMSTIPCYRKGLPPGWAGLEIGMAHGYFLYGPFAYGGPFRNADNFREIGIASASALIFFIGFLLLAYGGAQNNAYLMNPGDAWVTKGADGKITWNQEASGCSGVGKLLIKQSDKTGGLFFTDPADPKQLEKDWRKFCSWFTIGALGAASFAYFVSSQGAGYDLSAGSGFPFAS